MSYNPMQAGTEMAARRAKIAEAKRQLVETLSNGKIKLNAAQIDTGATVEPVCPEKTQKLNTAKAEMRRILSGEGIKQNAGIPNVTHDSAETNIPTGRVYDGGYQITAHGRTLEQLLAEEQTKASEPSDLPATNSGERNAESNSVQHAQDDLNDEEDDQDDEGGDYAPSQSQVEPEFSPEKVKADLFQWSMGEGGFVDKRKAKSVFLLQHGKGETAADYVHPLAVIGNDGEPVMSEKLLSEAWKHADGTYSGLANRAAQARIVRIKRHANIPLSDDENDFVQRHMSAMTASRFYSVDSSPEMDEQLLKYDASYTKAIHDLHCTLRGGK